MKIKGILTFCLCLCMGFAFGQIHDFDNRGMIYTNGAKVNIGANAFTASNGVLNVNGDISVKQGSSVRAFRTDGISHNLFSMDNNDDLTFNSSSLTPFGNRKSSAIFVVGDGRFFDVRGADGQKMMRVFEATGNVGIGTDDPGAYKLAVEGKIGCREAQVLSTSFADFVFEEDYNLPTLESVDQFIKLNKHLPEIPSQADVTEAGGFELGALSVKLLQKVEELTLYTIEQEKRIKALELQLKNK